MLPILTNSCRVKTTLNLLVSRIYLVAALIWTVVIAYLCLANANDIPKITNGFDKQGHFSLHCCLVLLWFMHFHAHRPPASAKNNIKSAFLISFFYGILIEACQALFTNTRTADLKDILANSIGGLAAIVLILLYLRIDFFKNDKPR